MTVQTVQSVGTATLPRVNLMPPEIAEAARFRRLQLGMGAAVVLSAVAVGGLYVHARSGVTAAQTQLDSAQQQQTSLQAKLSSLAAVKQTYAAVQAKQQMLSDAMGGEIRWSYVLNDLSFRIPSNVWLTAVQASETTPGSAPTSGTTPSAPLGAPATYGSVTFNGVAMAHDDVARWLDQLAQERGFTNPTFSNSNEDAIGARTVYDFGTSVVLDAQALSNRYVPKAGS